MDIIIPSTKMLLLDAIVLLPSPNGYGCSAALARRGSCTRVISSAQSLTSATVCYSAGGCIFHFAARWYFDMKFSYSKWQHRSPHLYGSIGLLKRSPGVLS